MFKSDGSIKIGDFGHACLLTQQNQTETNSIVGTSFWKSPEIIKGIPYSKEVDVWAFGCFAYELATGHPPFLKPD